MKKKKKESYLPIVNLIQQIESNMPLNDNESILSSIEVCKKHGVFLNADQPETVRAMILQDAMFQFTEDPELKATFNQVMQTGKPMDFDDIISALSLAANLLALKAMALKENVTLQHN